MKLPKNIYLRKRKNGTYEIRYTEDKKRISIYGKTVKEVYNKYLMLKKTTNTRKKTTLKLYQWLDEYLELKKPLIKDHSWKTIETCIRLHIKPRIKDKELKNYTVKELQEALNKIIQGKTREYSASVISEAFKMAYENKLIEENVCKNIRVKKHVREEGHALTHEEQKIFLETVKGSKHKLIFYFYYFTGCRMNEALRIKIKDVDKEKEIIYIDGTKNLFSKRYIPLFPGLKDIIKEIEEKAQTEYLFSISETTLKREIASIKKKLPFKFSIKDLRTTFGTNQAEAGVNLKTLQKWMGHARVSTTEKYYVKILSDFERKEAEKFTKKIDE